VVNIKTEKQREVMLFDRKKDPFQMNNIADESPKLIREMSAMLKQWLSKYQDPWLVNLN
jgi:hypothetical protein